MADDAHLCAFINTIFDCGRHVLLLRSLLLMFLVNGNDFRAISVLTKQNKMLKNQSKSIYYLMILVAIKSKMIVDKHWIFFCWETKLIENFLYFFVWIK